MIAPLRFEKAGLAAGDRFTVRRRCWRAAAAVACLCAAGPVAAADDAAAASQSYALSVRDLIEVTIFDEPELAATQRIDSDGRINLALVGPVVVAGRTVREAEEFVAQTYVEKRLLRRPMATVRVLEYAPREVSVAGQVHAPGMVAFPKEARSIDIVEVIARCGGFTGRANQRRVQITRLGGDGRPIVIEINVEDIVARGRGEPVPVFPGDIVFVPSTLF